MLSRGALATRSISWLAVTGGLALAGCGVERTFEASTTSSSASSTSASSAASSGSGGAGGSSASSASSTSGSGGAGGTGGGPVCTPTDLLTERIPVTMFLSLDRSSSMLTNAKWDKLRSGVKQFIQDPASFDLQVALRLWPDVLGQGGCNANQCDVLSCEKPNVAVGPLSDPAHRQALANELDQYDPEAGSSIPLISLGAANGVSKYVAANPGERAVLVIAADQSSDTCPVPLGAAVTEVQQLNAVDGVKTVVIDLDLGAQNSLLQLANAGGVPLVDLSPNFVIPEIVAVLEQIRAQLPTCSYHVPPPPFDPSLFQVKLTVGGMSTLVPQVNGANACGATGGFYLDDPANPSSIDLCPATCQKAKDAANELLFQQGCP